MSLHLAGLLVLNALFLLSGSGLLWGLRGWRDGGDWLALSGVAYLLGLGSTTVAMTVVLVAGGSASTLEILGVSLGLGVVGTAVGVVRGRPRPRGWRLRAPGTVGDVAAAVFGLATAVELLVFAADARVEPLINWDGWTFWIPKAKVIYFFGGIDGPLFPTLQGPSYPLFVPTLDAMDFRFMRSADTILLGFQYWLLLAGFVVALAGLLRKLAPPALTWLFAASVVVLPQLDARLLSRIGDWPLDFFFALAALALARWVATGERWPLGVFTVALAAVLATKREGQLLALCLVLAGVAALGWRRRRGWIGLVGLSLLAYAVNVPWRLWWTSRHLTPDTPAGGVLGSTLHFSRLPQSFGLVFRLLFDFGLWQASLPIALAAALLLLTHERRELAVLYLVMLALGIVGWAWVNWSDPTLAISTKDSLNPTDRAVGSLALLSVAFAPLLLAPVLAAVPARVGAVLRESGRPALP